METPRLIDGGLAVDDRGVLSFVNTFGFDGVKRFYQVRNFSKGVVRAFHGHKKEGKYVYVTKGSAIVAAVPFDSDTAPRKDAPVTRVVLSDRKPQVFYIPPGYANGFRPLDDDTVILFFSTSTLEESKGDDIRFPADYFGAHIWIVENR